MKKVEATRSFSASTAAGHESVEAGDQLPAQHPLARAYPHMFKPARAGKKKE